MAGEELVEGVKLAGSLASSAGIAEGLASVAMLVVVALVFGVVHIARANDWIERRRATRIEALIGELGKPYTWQNSFVFELAFLRYLGKIVDHGDLIALLSRPDAARSVTRYAPLQKYVRIDRSSYAIEFCEGYVTPWQRRRQRGIIFLGYLVFASIATMLAMRGYAMAAAKNGSESVEAIAISVLLFIFAFICIAISEDIGAAERLVEESTAALPAVETNAAPLEASAARNGTA